MASNVFLRCFVPVLLVAASCSTPKVGITSTPAQPGIQMIARAETGDGAVKHDKFRVSADTIPSDDTCPVATLHKNECAPYDGTLLSACATARIIAELESVDAKVAAEVKMAEDIERAKCVLEAAKVAADRKAEKTVSDKQIAARDAQIKAMNKQLASQQSPMFWMGLGVAGGATVTVLAVLAVSAASK